jgi:hypothetical protein
MIITKVNNGKFQFGIIRSRPASATKFRKIIAYNKYDLHDIFSALRCLYNTKTMTIERTTSKPSTDRLFRAVKPCNIAS